MRRWFVLVALIILITGAAMGGDIATFENLGFSETADTFVFGQYGVTGEESNPFAEIYFVNVSRNVFLPDGTYEYRSTQPLSLGQNGSGALFTAMREADPMFRSESINHLSTGRPIYILVDGEQPRERLTFRDFNTSVRYDVRLIQRRRGEGEDVSAAFHVELRLTRPDESVQTATIGRPSFYRDGVSSYRITQILVGPDERSLVIVVEKRAPDGTIRYMVETAAL